LNPVAVTIFIGMILTVVVYSVMDLTGLMLRLGRFGPVLPLILISWLALGIYLGLRRLKRRSTRIRIKGPLFMRSLMNNCLERTIGLLERKLKTPHLSSVQILNDILLDRIWFVHDMDCLRFSDIRRQIEGGRLKGSDNLQLASFFQSELQYDKQPLPEEIQQAQELILRSRTDLSRHLEDLKKAHRGLCTGLGDLLTLLPPDAKKIDRIRATYRYRPPAKEQARRMAFALEALAYLKATRHENVNPMDRKRYQTVAAKVIPQLANALSVYRQRWQSLVDAYERPQRERMETEEGTKNSISP
jgi:hypothetical protein